MDNYHNQKSTLWVFRDSSRSSYHLAMCQAKQPDHGWLFRDWHTPDNHIPDLANMVVLGLELCKILEKTTYGWQSWTSL